ncbi:MAG: pyridoxamine 5'-phosphate oxidase family protein [Thermoleophilia bacterium]|nr:pyridoxamine 5'-phosphate oxidase family protein [Thermoleophilia bacterium]
MSRLPENVQRTMEKAHNVWVATVGEDGWPNVAIKGSGALLDDEHLYYADLFSKKTRVNLAHDDRVAVGIFDPDNKVAVQVKGRADTVTDGDLFHRVAERIAGLQAGLPPIQAVVRIQVESVWNLGAGAEAGERMA